MISAACDQWNSRMDECVRYTKDRIIASNVSFSLETITLDFFRRDIFNRLSRIFFIYRFLFIRFLALLVKELDIRDPLFLIGI